MQNSNATNFHTLLSKLSKTLEQLANAHEVEVEAAYKGVRFEGVLTSKWQHPHEASVIRPGEALAGNGEYAHRGDTKETSSTAKRGSIIKRGRNSERQTISFEKDLVDEWGANAMVPQDVIGVSDSDAEDSGVIIASADDRVLRSASDNSSKSDADEDIGVIVACADDRVLRSASDNSSQSADNEKDLGRTSRSTIGSRLSFGSKFFQFKMRRPWSDFHEFEEVRITEELKTQKLKSRITTRMSAIVQRTETERVSSHVCSGIVLHPDSARRTFWVLLCIFFLLYDLIMVPVDICFALEETRHSVIMSTAAAIFWTVDILLNFFTGVRISRHQVEKRLSRIAIMYVTSYLFFDLILVIPEWVSLATDGFQGEGVAVMRVLRWGRFIRLLRVARIMRLLRLRPLLRQLIFRFHISTVYLQVTQGWIGLCLLYVLSMHVLACFWYAIGNLFDDGWVHANNLESATVLRKYIISLHWCISRPYGLTSDNQINEAAEKLVDALIIIISLALMSFFIGTATATCMARASSKTMTLWKFGTAYVRRHQISEEVDKRLVKVLEAMHAGGAGEVEGEERALLTALPESLQHDLLFEARVSHLWAKTFFQDMALVNERVVRHVTIEAVSPRIAVEREVLFAFGDACNSVLFITSGAVHYAESVSPDAALGDGNSTPVMRHMPSIFSGSSQESADSGKTFARRLAGKAVVGEPVLWTLWEHFGSLFSGEETTLLELDAARFAEVIVQHTGSCVHMVKYAKRFVWNLNHCAEMVNDLTEFPALTLEHLDDELYDGTAEDHFIFISHYKVEAGTEATLMRDSMEPIFSSDLNHPANDLRTPIFIDSEDLVDLTQLKLHVERSYALILLLTPGVLLRPWCLIEIVTAIKCGVNIVPVEVQRPGSKYQYPDEDFYKGLLAGTLLNDGAINLLQQENVNLDEVEQAVRRVFLKIALPFSPHKSKAVRDAELQDILKRCGSRGSMKARGSAISRSSES